MKQRSQKTESIGNRAGGNTACAGIASASGLVNLVGAVHVIHPADIADVEATLEGELNVEDRAHVSDDINVGVLVAGDRDRRTGQYRLTVDAIDCPGQGTAEIPGVQIDLILAVVEGDR